MYSCRYIGDLDSEVYVFCKKDDNVHLPKNSEVTIVRKERKSHPKLFMYFKNVKRSVKGPVKVCMETPHANHLCAHAPPAHIKT